MGKKNAFSDWKAQTLQENETRYGTEIRERYGKETVEEANRRFSGMTPAEKDKSEKLEKAIISGLLKAMAEGDVHSETAREVVVLHREWLKFFWPSYSPEAHKGLADLYIQDERFREHFDRHRPGAAQFLRDSIHANL